ncbi:YkvA family protein [Devosia sp.]|uniref:YkvA family protein n=1 Tax=Devosia sp. TaxID=1871048 RepID=UPI003A93EA69
MLARLRAWAGRLKRDIVAVWLAARDPQTPWLARWMALVVVAYAVSPIDLIPDFIPVLGLLDDLLLVPLGLWLVIRLIPASVLTRCRADAESADRPRSTWAGAVVIGIWVVVACLCLWWVTGRQA